MVGVGPEWRRHCQRWRRFQLDLRLTERSSQALQYHLLKGAKQVARGSWGHPGTIHAKEKGKAAEMGVDVDLEAIRSLAGDFRAAADSVGERAATFGESALLGSDAFGPLPAGRQAEAHYRERRQMMIRSLQELQATLRQFARNLDATAENWEQADQGSTPGPVR
jgi:uncharacterized protein YukE